MPSFERDLMMQNAVMRQIQIIGEAANRISRETQDANPEVSWPEIIGMRNRLVHDYVSINARRVWAVTQNDLLPLIAVLESILEHSESA